MLHRVISFSEESICSYKEKIRATGALTSNNEAARIDVNTSIPAIEILPILNFVTGEGVKGENPCTKTTALLSKNIPIESGLPWSASWRLFS